MAIKKIAPETLVQITSKSLASVLAWLKSPNCIHGRIRTKKEEKAYVEAYQKGHADAIASMQMLNIVSIS